jgi:RHH-type proline utilization regulon transcriptional repressor/proline dehydrogenase/delta 1-pyrroline-5-carboxylate dehydrogenase
VQEEIAGRFCEMLAGAMMELSVGDPARLSTDVGPVIDEAARKELADYVAEMEKTNRVIARAPDIASDVAGTFLRPVAFEIGKVSDLRREVFGPVLHVVRFRAGAIDALVEEINALGYGLTMGVHSRIDETMHSIVANARVGNIYVNRNQIGAVVGVQPFGGEGLSGTGPKAGGPHYLSALKKSPAPAGGDKITISATAPLPLFDQQLKKAERAFARWSAMPARRNIFVRASTAAGEHAELFRLAGSLYARYFEAAQELPGPTGESNTLRLKGRGVVLCLGGGGEAANRRQIALALAAGNAILCAASHGDRAAAALAKAEAPDDLIASIPNAQIIHEAALLDPRVKAVAFDGAEESRKAIAAALARRDGAIIPLLSSLDHPARFAVERTLTINTTAAGGDVRLLSLSK